MNEASDEQKVIIDYIDNYNVLVDSVAGSGKTTTILHIAKKYPSKQILLLTYNKKLRIETKSKTEKLELNNLEVHTYHSFCYKYYDKACHTDCVIRQILNNNLRPINSITKKYDIVILDESQDMTPLYFQLIFKIISEFVDYSKDNQNNQNNQNNRLCVLGDKFQSIYSFNNADARFIIHAKELFAADLGPNKLPWKDAKLSLSFRLTNEMGKFLNNCVLREDRIRTNKTIKTSNIDRAFTLGSNVRYIVCNCFNDVNNRIYNEILMYLKEYNVNDMFILAPSLKSDQCGIRILANKLSKDGYAVYVPSSDDEKIDDDILRNKIAFSTFHQAKGLERKVCVVFNFDDSYFKYYKKDIPQNLQNICPNEIYVALTRASERLTVLHHETNNHLPFLNIQNLRNNCYYEFKPLKLCTFSNKFKVNNKLYKEKPIHVNDLLSYLPSDITDHALGFITFQQIQTPDKIINIPTKIENKTDNTNNIDGEDETTYETVSDINSVALQSYFEFVTKNKMTINKKNHKLDIKGLTPGKLLLMANTYCSMTAGYNYKMNQISKYNWLKRKDLDDSIERLKKIIDIMNPNGLFFEKDFEHSNEEELMKKGLCGKISCIDNLNKNIYMFKCTSDLSKEHFLQLSLLAYLNEVTKSSTETNYNYFLYNILTNEMYKINIDVESIKKMVRYLIEYKYFSKQVNNDDFVKSMKELANKQKQLTQLNQKQIEQIEQIEQTIIKPKKVIKNKKKIIQFFD